MCGRSLGRYLLLLLIFLTCCRQSCCCRIASALTKFKVKHLFVCSFACLLARFLSLHFFLQLQLRENIHTYICICVVVVTAIASSSCKFSMQSPRPRGRISLRTVAWRLLCGNIFLFEVLLFRCKKSI